MVKGQQTQLDQTRHAVRREFGGSAQSLQRLQWLVLIEQNAAHDGVGVGVSGTVTEQAFKGPARF